MTAGEVLKQFADDVQDVQSRYVIVHQLRASADIQAGEITRTMGRPATTDRAELMREAADVIERLVSRPSETVGGALAPLFMAVEMADDYNRLAVDRLRRLAKDFLLDSELRALAAALRTQAPAKLGSAGDDELIETIRTRLLGVAPDDQDVVLEDGDWRLILSALGQARSREHQDGPLS